MPTHRTRMNADERIQLPAQLQGDLEISPSATVDLGSQDGQAVVRRPTKALERIPARLSKYVEPGSDVVGELKAQRIEDAQRG